MAVVAYEIALPKGLPFEPGSRAYRMGECAIIVSRPGGLWHLSISTPYRNPKWSEIVGARYALVPDETYMAMILPPRSEYVNLHPYCFHLHEIAADERVAVIR